MTNTATDLADYYAAVTAVELREQTTVLRERFRSPHGSTIAAISANGRWGYEKEGRRWVIIDKTETGRQPLRFETSLVAARRLTFDLDHPMHGPAREPRPVRFTVA